MKKSVLLIGAFLFGMTSYAQTYTFTTGGATGQFGPSQAQLTTAYTGTNLAGTVTSTSGVQYWVVPGGGSYLIKAVGASGGGVSAGLGAEMEGTFILTGGDTLLIVVGQKGVDGLDGSASGGGGSYVVLGDPTSSTITSLGRKVTPLLVAGGGGGNPGVADADCDGNTTTNGDNGNGLNGSGIGGVNGNGGGISVPSGNNRGGGGGGFLTDGEHTGTCTSGEESGLSFLNGCQGGKSTSCGTGQYAGGFGGGGGAISTGWRSSGGGGGYSGGGGGQTNSVATTHRGGGGGSFSSGTNQVNGVSALTGDGMVEITVLSACASPTNLSANVVRCDSIILDWTQAADSGIVFFVPTGSSPTNGTLVVGDSTLTLTSSMASTVYDVYVVNICGGDTSSVFGPVSVNTGTTGAPVADFTSTSPGFNTTVDFDASASTGTGNTYAWDFGDGNTGTGITTSHTYAMGGSYAVELTVTNTCGVSDSTVTLAGVGLDENILSQSLVIFPNPASDGVTVKFEAPQGSAVTLRVLDISGKEVLTQKRAIEGAYTFEIGTLAKGYYMLEISSGNLKAMKSLIKQ